MKLINSTYRYFKERAGLCNNHTAIVTFSNIYIHMHTYIYMNERIYI